MARICVALDLEFTGLDINKDEIIEVGAVAFQGRRELGRFQTFVRPGIPLPLQTERLTGISRADIARAPRFSEVAPKLRDFIGDAPIVGQNSPRDLEVLAKQGLALSNPAFDTFDLASMLMPELSSYTLASVAEALGIRAGSAHRALADALMTRDVYLALLDRADQLDSRTLSEIVQLTSMTEWPIKLVFQDIEREQARRPVSTLGAALAAKIGLDAVNVDFLTRSPERIPVVEPTGEEAHLETVADAFVGGGSLAGVLPGFEEREEQQIMAQAVANAFAEGENLVVEAGTGTGKSFAYLLPAATLAKQTGERVVIATNTLALQDQIIQKDVPRVIAAIGAADAPRVAVVKGRTNYLCLRRWADFRKSGLRLTLDEVKVLCRILVWLPRTATGDRAELNLSPGEQAVWSRISAQMDDCLTGSCSFHRKGTCFLYRARREAEGAHLVVVNHALLLSDLAAEHAILPPYDHLVVDEAHHLEDEATRQLGFSVGRRDVNRHLDALLEARGKASLGLIPDLRSVARSAPDQTRQAVETATNRAADDAVAARPLVDALFTAISAFLKATGEDSDPRRRLTNEIRGTAAWSAVVEAWDNLRTRLAASGDHLAAIQRLSTGLISAKIEGIEDLLLELNAQQRANFELRDRLQAIIVSPDPDSVTWVETGPGQTVLLSSAPLDVSGLLGNTIFAEKRGVVLTSATLAADGGFDYVRSRLGVGKASEVLVGSPFNYAENALIVVPSDPDFPEPNRPGHDQKVAEALISVAIATGGKMLALFTSNSALRRARQIMRPALEKRGIVVLGQNIDGPRGQLLNTFRSNKRTVLLGTASFWEGVDVPGDALSVLAITKLPFGVPSDPVFAARSERIDNSFNNYAVPQAIVRFRQGIGRLIRHKTDRGVALILDTRIRTKGYGAAFRRSLPSPIAFLPVADIPNRTADFLRDTQ